MSRICPRCGRKYGDVVRQCDPCQMRLVAITARHDTLLGTSIDGRFTITELIARGGMGSVYRAYQPSIDRHIAVKVLHPNISADETMLRRFFREAKAISSLHHHNIVQIFDFGQSQEGLLYMVMEFLDGPVLHDVINRGPVPPLRTVNILSQVCDALSAAHGRGIIHRDLKPENIVLLDRAGAPDFVKILDFGLARMAHGSGSDAEKLTEANQFFGTPMYMSPEQVGASDLDGRSDLYSLGIILFEMLVGQPPFTGDSPMSIILAHSRDEPPLLSDACHAYVVPPQLTALCAQLLEKDPARRPPSAAQVKATLREAFETFPGGGFLDPTRASAVTPVALPRVDAGRELATQSLVFRGPGEDHQLMETVMHEVKTPLTVVNSGARCAHGPAGAVPAHDQAQHPAALLLHRRCLDLLPAQRGQAAHRAPGHGAGADPHLRHGRADPRGAGQREPGPPAPRGGWPAGGVRRSRGGARHRHGAGQGPAHVLHRREQDPDQAPPW